MYYFAYGSNLNHEQMKTRCPSAKFIGKTKLHDYKRTFDGGNSSIWKANTANLQEDRNSATWGAIFEMNDQDFEALKILEGNERYLPYEATSYVGSGGKQITFTYFRKELDVLGPPSDEYLAVMKQGLIDCGLEDDVDLDVLIDSISRGNKIIID